MTAPEAFTTGDRTEQNKTVFSSADESNCPDLRECATCREEFHDGYPVDEMMTAGAGRSR